jgi:epoxyqueuosine reductase
MLARASELNRVVKEAAAEAGFDLAGIAGVGEFPELDYFPAWIAEGRGGEMAYLQERDEQGRLRRASLRSVAPWARSVVVCALNYNTEAPCSTQVHDSDRGWISRYAWSRRDYHNVVMKRLKQVEEKISCQLPVASGQKSSGQWAVSSGQQTHKREIRTRAYVDTGPLVERVYACAFRTSPSRNAVQLRKICGPGWVAMCLAAIFVRTFVRGTGKRRPALSRSCSRGRSW